MRSRRSRRQAKAIELQLVAPASGEDDRHGQWHVHGHPGPRQEALRCGRGEGVHRDDALHECILEVMFPKRACILITGLAKLFCVNITVDDPAVITACGKYVHSQFGSLRQ